MSIRLRTTAGVAVLAVLALLVTTLVPGSVDTRPHPASTATATAIQTAAAVPTAVHRYSTADPGDDSQAIDVAAPAQLPPATVLRLAQRAARGLVDITTSNDDGPLHAGTGIVIDSDGFVITNDHVIRGATTFTAYDHGTATTYDATLVGTDRRHDIAVLRLRDAADLPTPRLGLSAHTRLGATVITVGNAYGAGTLQATAGPITALHASTTVSVTEQLATTGQPAGQRLTGLIQATTWIVPGDSGGAMLDTTGAVIGVNVARALSGAPAGSGYAIPLSTALRIARALIHAADNDDT